MEQVNENNLALQLFEGEQVRFVWDEEKEIYYFSVVDIVRILTESADATAYWRKLKQRLKEEGNETVTNCHALKLPAADGKNRLTDVADLEGIFRIIQSVPSKKAEPVKQWLAEIGHQRIDQMIDPERRLMWRAQTPQAFRLPLIRDAYQRALQDPQFQATDDCGVVRKYMPGTKITVVEGSDRNLKVTTPQDLAALKQMLING